MIEAVFAFFALPWVPWSLSGLLILGALALWLHFRWRLRPVVAGLNDALAVIEEVPGPGAFRDRFASLDQRLGANPVIGDSWRAFAQTLVPVPGREDCLGSTRRAAEDFNETLVANAGVNLRFYTAVPNYLVGLGLLFTFLGLVAALYFASSGVAASDIRDAQGALRDLLAAATFKFVTSIAGLGTSIVYSWREKHQIYQIGRRLARLCTALEQRLLSLTPEYLGTVQLAEMKTQSTLLRRLGRHIHVTIPETIEERIATELLDAIAPMREGFVNAARRLGGLDERLAERLAAGSAASPGEPAAPVRAAGVEAVALGPLLVELRALHEAIEGLPQSAPVPAPGGREERALAQALPRFVELFDSSCVGIDALDSRLEVSLRGLKTALRELQSALASTEPRRLEAVFGDLAASLQSLAGIHEELEDLGRAFREVATDSRALLMAHQDRAESDELTEALEQLGRRVERFNDRVRNFVGKVDEELARSSNLLSAVVSGLDRRPPE